MFFIIKVTVYSKKGNAINVHFMLFEADHKYDCV